MFVFAETTIFIVNCRNVRGLGESVVVFRLFEKLIQMKDQLNFITGGKWQYDSSSNIISNREFYGLGRQATKFQGFVWNFPSFL